MATATLYRLPEHSDQDVTDAVARDTIGRLSQCATSNALIETALHRLDREWDVERAVQASASALTLAGVVLAARDRRWLWLPVAAGAFLLQHAVQGWCPSLSIFRRAGLRTSGEVARERYALKAMRGDFAGLGMDRGIGCARRAYAATRPR